MSSDSICQIEVTLVVLYNNTLDLDDPVLQYMYTSQHKDIEARLSQRIINYWSNFAKTGY